MSKRRVVVAGLGVVAPCGNGVEAFWRGLLGGISYAERLAISKNDLPLIGCSVPDTCFKGHFTPSEMRRLDRIAMLALVAADDAMAGVKVQSHGIPAERCAVVVGIGFGGIGTLTQQHRVLLERGPHRLSAFGIPAVMPSSVAVHAALRFGIKGPATTVSSACASGTQAIIEASRLIEHGLADLVLAGGAEAPLDLLAMASFERMRALSKTIDDPKQASRPFDVDRSGFVLGEGAGFLVLVEYDIARRASLNTLAEVVGGAITTDAQHITAPDSAALGATRCIGDALRAGALEPADIAHVNAHGTATKLNDLSESKALELVFGPHGIPVTSIKGAIGHLMGGAGAVEAIATVLGMNHNMAPQTVNCAAIDPLITADVVIGAPRELARGAAMSCSFGFGGQNAAVVFTPLDGVS